MWYRRVYTSTLRTYSVFCQRVLGRASFEIQSGVRFFHVGRGAIETTTTERKNRMKKTILTILSAATLAVLNCFAGDNLAEIEAALAREAQSKPRLMAASPKLLSATGDDNTYLATGELNVTKSRGTISLQFDIPKAYTHITSATLTMNAYDVDYTRATERDEVYFNNTQIGRLVGGDNVWNVNTFSVPASAIHTGINILRIEVDVDNLGWVTRIEYAKLVIDGVVDYIRLDASTTYDDRIKLKWSISSGLVAEPISLYRGMSENGYFEPVPEAKRLFAKSANIYHYSDKSCLPGVKYYYYMVSSSGVQSDTVVGKRTVKVIDPKIDFTLIGTDHPLDIGEIGISGETDVLVAGRTFRCRLTLETPEPNCNIKYVRLIGYPAGGAAYQKRHNIVCFINGSVFDELVYRDWVKGKMVLANSNTFEFNAILKAGKGYHGEYNWSMGCEYEINGKTSYKTFSGPRKNVYFEKDGIDNCEKSKYVFGDRIPNWYVYWRDDGACPGLKDNRVYYRGRHVDGMKCGGAANDYVSYDSDRCVMIDREAGMSFHKETLNNPHWDNAQNTFFEREGKPVYGIYNVEDIVAHEWQHHKTRILYNAQTSKNNPEPDSDKRSQICTIDVGTCGKCESYDREICDYIVDKDEVNGFILNVSGKSFTVEGLDPTLPDTYSLNKKKAREYGAYGDNELISMVAGRMGMYNADATKDWAYPGEQAGGIKEYKSNMKLKSALLANTSLTGESNSTNIHIKITSISAREIGEINCVTGVVFTLATSIQSDEIVNFTGYLFGANTNVVATAISAASAESESVELVFDARNIYDNFDNGGPFTLGRIDLTIDGNYNTNNTIGVLYDLNVVPVEIEKERLLCNKAKLLDETTGGVSEMGVDVFVPAQINVEADYQVTAELVNTNGELIAIATVSNICAVGTNTFALAFSSDSIFQSGVDGFNVVRNLKLWSGDELIDADAGPFELPTTYCHTDFVPSNSYVTVDLMSERFLVPDMTADGKLSSLKFYFDVTNGTDETISYDVSAVLLGTNTEMVASIISKINVTNGVNRVEIIVPASAIAASNVDGPYWFRSVELQPQDEDTCGATFWPKSQSGVYKASDFGNATFEIDGTPEITALVDYDRLSLEYSYDATRTGEIVVEAVLVDKNGDFVARVINTNDVAEIGIKTNTVTITCRDITGEDAGAPYAVANISLRAGIDGEMPIYANTEGLTNIYWRTARCFVDANTGSDSNDGKSWDKAYKTISYAIPFANSNNAIAVKSGLYAGFTTSNSAITIIAVDGPNTTIIDGGGERRCANLGSNASQTNTVLVGFTLRNGLSSTGGGVYGGTLKNCIIESNKATNGGGGVCYSVLEDCQLKNNSARYGGGAYMTVLRRCLVSGNEATGSYGGGISESTAYDCIIQGNSAATMGGGTEHSELYNCTIVENSALQYGGGVYDSMIVNSIIWDNTAAASNNHYMAQGVYSCTIPLLDGDGNIDSDPCLCRMEDGSFMLSYCSPCLDAGLDNGASAKCKNKYGNTTVVTASVSSVDFFGNIRVKGAAGTEVVPSGAAIYAIVAARKYEDLATALSEAQPGETIGVYANTTLFRTAAVAVGVSLVIAPGVTLTVADGATLYVDGSSSIKGVVSGSMSQCIKLIKQVGKNGEPFFPYDGDQRYQIKYWKTVIETPLGRISGASSHITIVNGYGETVYRGTNANAFVCTINKNIALNHITSVRASCSSGTDAYHAVAKSGGSLSSAAYSIKSYCASELVLLTVSDTIDLGSTASGFTTDCAGYNISFRNQKLSNMANVVTINGATVALPSSAPLVNARLTAINCASVNGVQINNNTIEYCASVHLYDCGGASSFRFEKSNVILTAGAPGICFFSGGPYTQTFTANHHVYGGAFSRDPTSYLASSDLEVTKDGNSWVVRKIAANVSEGGVGTDVLEPQHEDVSVGVISHDTVIHKGVHVDMGAVEGEFFALEGTQSTPIPVPYVWLEKYGLVFDSDYESAAMQLTGKTDVSGKPIYVWQDYIAGTDPGDTNSVFRANIVIIDGEPNITWEPDTPELRATRTYTTYGKKTLLDSDWTPVTDSSKKEYHFFKVEVNIK